MFQNPCRQAKLNRLASHTCDAVTSCDEYGCVVGRSSRWLSGSENMLDVDVTVLAFAQWVSCSEIQSRLPRMVCQIRQSDSPEHKVMELKNKSSNSQKSLQVHLS